MRLFLSCAAIAAFLFVPTTVSAQTFTERALGDFSGVSASPTVLGQLDVGTSTILGTTGSGDRDIVTFRIGVGLQLTSFLITDFSEAGGHFFGFDSGADVGSNVVAGDFLFAGLVTDPTPSLEILGSSGGSVQGSGGTGVPSVLGPGDYTAFFNDTAGVSPDYTAVITVSAIPEPTTGVLLLGSAGLMLLQRRRLC